LFVHSSKRIHAKKQDRFTRLYNRAWGKWRKQQPTCSACSNIATFHCPNADTYYCPTHWLATHQPVKNTKDWICEHLAHLNPGQQQMVCYKCGKQYKLVEGQLAPTINTKPGAYLFGCDACVDRIVAERDKSTQAVTGGSKEGQ